ncbi:aminotransferase class V-fold PLP-dependent enzyme [Bailinhaonella thermotolerans]|uniref:Aminotransferase class V-fold PLP-dependent enzyme n=1 Tax=Bailinhaonella thermotolerans TaxID=1070861 RepID=A0A3A4AMY2_9ACTN|nr:aminotransferase class V-fold PLP-dependent enzyme [Bailinhaonella thermotolerans]
MLGADLTVPVSSGELVPYANLDYAASAPCLRPVRDAIDAALPAYSSVHRGAGYASQLTTQRYEQARHSVRAFAGAREDDAVIFTRNTTDAMNLLSGALPPYTTVVVFETEHHAALLPWQRGHRVVRLAAPRSPAEAVAAARQALSTGPVGSRLLAVTAASNVTGELWPIAELARVAHEAGARIVVDAAQLAPHRPLEIAALDLDYVAFSGHKLYAPFGAGVLIGRPDWLSAAEPYLYGGGASRNVTSDVEWHEDPEQRHEAGTPNVLGALALAAACDALTATGWDSLIAEEERLLARLRTGLAEIPGVRELTLWDEQPRVGIVSFVVDGWTAREVAEKLSSDHAIGVRDGKFCAHPFVRHLLGAPDTDPATEPGGSGCGTAGTATAIRASFGVGTQEEHIDRLLLALHQIATTTPA